MPLSSTATLVYTIQEAPGCACFSKLSLTICDEVPAKQCCTLPQLPAV